MRPIRPAALVTTARAGMFQFGIVMALLGAILPVVSGRLQFDLGDTGGLFLAMNAAMLGASLVSGPLMDRFGLKPALAAGPLAIGSALAMIATARSYPALAGALGVLGAGGGLVNAGANTLVADLFADPYRKNSALNILGIYFGFGALLLPFTIGALIDRAGLETLLGAAASLSAATAVLAMLLKFPPAKQGHSLPVGQMVWLARNRLVRSFGAMLFLQSGSEFIIGGFLSSLLTSEYELPLTSASYILACYWATVMVARLGAARLLLRLDGRKLIAGSALVAAAGVAILETSRAEFSAGLAVIVIGAGVAGIFPTALGLAGTAFREYSGTVFGLLFAMALTGGMILPWLTGQLAEAVGLGWALVPLMVAFLLIAGLAASLKRHIAAAPLSS